MPSVEINGARLNYVQMGGSHGKECEDLVMIHGLATNMAFWYFQYAPAFSSRYRVTLYDLRGHGSSSVTEDGYSPANLAVDLKLLLDHLGIERAHFVTHSFGGVIALNFACSNPERVSSLVLADTHIGVIRHLKTKNDWEYGKRLQPILKRHGLDLDTSEPYFGSRLLTEIARLQSMNTEISPELYELLNPIIAKFGLRTANKWLTLMDTTSAGKELMGDDGLSLEQLGTLSFPIMAIYGENSPAMSTGEHLLDILPHADFRSVREGGHFFPSSRPDEVMGSINKFWDVVLKNGVPRRKGEPRARYFSSSRFINRNGAWFLFTREGGELGPFSNQEDMYSYLDSYLAADVVE
jgi:pimeloyl-ACP methyl ester carboxylesterase